MSSIFRRIGKVSLLVLLGLIIGGTAAIINIDHQINMLMAQGAK
jgi:hypothetical protein